MASTTNASQIELKITAI